jgi:hypothetical protein
VTAHRFGELATLFVAHVAGRSPHQSGHGVLLHVLRHVDADQGLFGVKEEFGQGAGQLGFTHPGWPHKQEGTQGATGVVHARPGPTDGGSHGGDRFVLTNHPLMQMSF